AVFFFQAEDGIRDFHVTGVQTCALPIWRLMLLKLRFSWYVTFLVYYGCVVLFNENILYKCSFYVYRHYCLNMRVTVLPASGPDRSEERRVGKECRSRWSTDP